MRSAMQREWLKSSCGEFYEEMIPVADELYDEHLNELREEGELP